MSDPGWKPDDAEKVCAQCGKSFAGRSWTVNLHPEEFCKRVCMYDFYEPISDAEIAWRKLSVRQKQRTTIYAELGGPIVNSVIQDDMTELMEAAGISTHARPVSPHDVMQNEIIPWVKRAADHTRRED